MTATIRRKNTPRITLIALLVLLLLAGGYGLATFLINYRPLVSPSRWSSRVGP